MPQEKKGVYVQLPVEDVEWLEEHYGYGAKTHFFSLFLRKFIEAHEQVPDEKVDEVLDEMGFA